jgi:phage recombination protein Bet
MEIQQITTPAIVNEKDLVKYLDVMGLGTNLTNQEKEQFLQIAKAFNLNPFKREIYCSKYGSNTSIIVGYETYIKRAERSGLLNGWKAITEGSVKEGTLRAVITINRKDWTEPFEHEVYYSEYVQLTKEGNPNKFWREKPMTMIKKVGISQAFRMCFSTELGGMPYTAEEIGTEEIAHEEISHKIEIKLKSLEDAIDELQSCSDKECAAAIWKAYKHLHKEPAFLEAKENLKQTLAKSETA